MSPSTYLIAVPLGVIAISSWLVKMEGDSFSLSQRTSGIQQVPRTTDVHYVPYGSRVPDASISLEHERYGWFSTEASGSSLLGMDAAQRPLGGRPLPPTDWAERQPATPASGRVELPPIPGFADMPTPAEPFFETVPAGSGFHIAADEATKLDMGKHMITFSGRVKLASPQFHLTSTKLVVHLGKDGTSFRLLEASGSVDVQLTGVPDEKKYRGQSGVGVYDPGKGTITLTGWPKIQGSGQELIAAEESTRVVLIPKTGKMITEGRAQTRVAKRLMEESPVQP